MKQCSCGRQYTADEWARLPLVGYLPQGDAEPRLELRNCASCRSTLAMPDAVEYGALALEHGPGGGSLRAWLKAAIDARMAWRRDGGRFDEEYFYGGLRAPPGMVALPGLAGRFVVVTPQPMVLHAMVDYELAPIDGVTGGLLALELSGETRLPVELASVTSDEPRAAALFRNPRGLWQVSYFDSRGPVGHEETAGEPFKLLGEAVSRGYRRWAPGVVDSMARSW